MSDTKSPSPSSVELVEKIRERKANKVVFNSDGDVVGESVGGYILSDSSAASLIDGIRRTVPRKMLEELKLELTDIGERYLKTSGVEEAEKTVQRVLERYDFTVEKE